MCSTVQAEHERRIVVNAIQEEVASLQAALEQNPQCDMSIGISVERSLECFGKFGLKMRLFIFKLFNPGLKFPDLVIGEIHTELKFINSFTQISSFGKHAVRIFAAKKYTKPFEWTIRFSDAFARVEMVVVSLISQCKMSESIVGYVNTITRIRRKLRIRMGGIQYSNIGYELCQYSF